MEDAGSSGLSAGPLGLFREGEGEVLKKVWQGSALADVKARPLKPDQRGNVVSPGREAGGEKKRAPHLRRRLYLK